MKIRSFTILISLLILKSCTVAQVEKKLTGTWQGTLNAGADLRIVFHIKENANGSLQTAADSPDQDSYGLQCDTTFASGESITIEMHDLHASFTGKLVNDSTIEGTFTQGAGLPLTLHRQKAKQESQPKENASASLPYKNVDISVKAKDVTLSGTLFQPLNTDKSAVVLIIAGSGPTDRDGNSNMLPGKNNSLLQLADSLNRHGIASLRYDKRGVGKSKMAPGLGEENMTINDMINDAIALCDWLKNAGYTDIYIAGHSEGSLIGMMTAASIKAKGFISIAGAGRKAGDILKEQTKGQLTGDLKTDFDNAIDSLEKGLTVTKVNPALFSLLRPSVQPYMKSWLILDPQKLIAKLSCPILITQGSKDIQVTETDAKNLNKAAKKSTLVIINNMTHVLKEVATDQRDDNIKTYSDPKLPVAQELVSSIVNFINQKAR
jgi:pimeloyl-ACP methyl ester carboxylesterase